MTRQSKLPYTELLLANPNEVRMGGVGMPSYGVMALSAFLSDFFLEPRNSGGLYITPPPGLADAELHGGKYLMISEQFSWDQDAVNTRGRLVITGGEISSTPMGLSRGMLTSNMLTGRTTSLYLTNHRYSINAYSREGAVAQRLAQLVQQAIRGYADTIREIYGFVSIDVPTIGVEQPQLPPEGSSRQELVMVPVATNAVMTSKWDTIPTGPKLGGIGLIVEDDQTKTVVDKIGTGPE